MAKQIKVIKCPQCGGNKPVAIDKDHYRCSKCDTEFILDSDDINVNVNHNYGQRQPQSSSSSKSILTFVIVFIVVIFSSIIFGIGFIIMQFKKTNNRTTVSTQSTVKSNIVFSVLLDVDGQSFAFYLEDDNTFLSDNGYSAVFYDIVNEKKIKEQNGLLMKESIEDIECRKFISDSSCYLIINRKYIYKIESNTLVDMYDEISSRKPALNSGYSKVFFMPEGYGEGFFLDTKLGKTFYYYPASDALYTENAMNHIMKGKFETLSSEATDIVYYLFKNKESKQSSNVSELYEITYKFNNGGPEYKLLNMSDIRDPNIHRIVSQKPITEEFICFSPKVLYYDKDYILITYKSTLAEDAVRNVRLLDTKGTVLWTVPVKYNIESEYPAKYDEDIMQKLYNVRTKNGFMLQNERNSLLEISMDGKTIKSYKLPK